MQIAVRGVLFDLDGVLVDSIATVERHWREFALANGLDIDSVLGSVHGQRTVENIRRLAPELDEAEATRAFEQLEVDDVSDVRTLPGAASLLCELDPRLWTIVTSGSTPVASARLGAAGLPIPMTMVTADAVSRGKPDPEGFVAGAAALEFRPEDCLVVEDSPAGVEAGSRAGAKTLALLTTHTSRELSKADYILEDLEGLTVVESHAEKGIRFQMDVG